MQLLLSQPRSIVSKVAHQLFFIVLSLFLDGNILLLQMLNILQQALPIILERFFLSQVLEIDELTPLDGFMIGQNSVQHINATSSLIQIQRNS